MTGGPRTSEVAFNGMLAEVLRRKHPLWKDHLGVEQPGVFPEHPGLRPDILVRPPNAQPVVVETEYAPARTVEQDACARLGLVTGSTADPIEQTIAVRVPTALRQGQADMPGRIVTAEFEYCIFSGEPSSPDRWPTTGWLTGTVDDIVRCIEHAMVSQRLVDESITVLERGVRVATQAIRDAVETGFTDTDKNLGAGAEPEQWRADGSHGDDPSLPMPWTLPHNDCRRRAAFRRLIELNNDNDGYTEKRTVDHLGLADSEGDQLLADIQGSHPTCW